MRGFGMAADGWIDSGRWAIDGWQCHYDGTGEHSRLHAHVFPVPCDGRRTWRVEVLEETAGERAESYTYGDTLPLTLKMAKEIAVRFVSGRKIPKRLEWR